MGGEASGVRRLRRRGRERRSSLPLPCCRVRHTDSEQAKRDETFKKPFVFRAQPFSASPRQCPPSSSQTRASTRSPCPARKRRGRVRKGESKIIIFIFKTVAHQGLAGPTQSRWQTAARGWETVRCSGNCLFEHVSRVGFAEWDGRTWRFFILSIRFSSISRNEALALACAAMIAAGVKPSVLSTAMLAFTCNKRMKGYRF